MRLFFLTPHRTLIVCTTILLTLWLSFASVEHALDHHPDHHAHHQCELFLALHHGIMAALLIVVLLPSRSLVLTALPRYSRQLGTFAYLARSPPTLGSCTF
ncbi:DUF2607 family protein [Vibrio cholerae]